MDWCSLAAGLVSSYSPWGFHFLRTWRPVALMSGSAWRKENKLSLESLYRHGWGSYCVLLRWLLLCYFISLSRAFFSNLPLVSCSCSLLSTFCASFDLSLSFSSHRCCSVFFGCLQYLSVSVSLYLLSNSHSFFNRKRCSWLLEQSNHWGQLKTPRWSHLASLRVIMKCADMLICTKPSLLMKTQYWLPFIRLIMKYQYHLPSPSASVNRASNECVSLQTHLDPDTYINPQIAADGCRKLIGPSFDGRLYLWSGEEKWLERSQQVELSHNRGWG